MLYNTTVNRNLRFDDICKEKIVKMAYSGVGYTRVDSEGKLIEWPASNPGMRKTMSLMIPYEWEIIQAFIENNNIHLQFIFGYDDFTLNQTTGLWSGHRGMMQSDEVDLSSSMTKDSLDSVITGQYFHYSAPIMKLSFHWFSRLPQKLSLTWNLLYLFPKAWKPIYFWGFETLLGSV